MGVHLIDGEFQSDKYPTCPRGKVPLSCKDETAQDLLWRYAQRRREVDKEFADDLEAALRAAGYKPPEGNVIAEARHALTNKQSTDRERRLANALLGLMDDSSLLVGIVQDELKKTQADRDAWRRRAEQHGCDVEHGDPECG